MKNGIGAVLAMAIIPASAFAVDGQVLINQSTVNAAGGFPYTITQPGSYKLSGNIVVPVGVNGFQINADGVTFDLNGFSITGGRSVGSTAFFGTSRQRIQIVNGTIVGLGGIVFSGASQYITIERINHDGFLFVNQALEVPTYAPGVELTSDVASHSLIRGVQSTSAIWLTCPGTVIDSTAGQGISELRLPITGSFDPIGTNCKAVNVY